MPLRMLIRTIRSVGDVKSLLLVQILERLLSQLSTLCVFLGMQGSSNKVCNHFRVPYLCHENDKVGVM
jgi:hypothetical protein